MRRLSEHAYTRLCLAGTVLFVVGFWGAVVWALWGKG